MQWVKAFAAGFIATLVFHQSVISLFWLLGLIPGAPYNLAPTEPFGVPAVISLAFWGGAWGLPLWWLIRRWSGSLYWAGATVAGAVGPTAVAILLVFPLKGLAVSFTTVVGGLIVNAAWGFGSALVMWALRRREAGAEATD